MKNQETFSKKEVRELLSEFNGSMPWSNEIDKHCTYGRFIKEKGLLEEELEVGKWYKSINHLFCCTSINDSGIPEGYGIVNGKRWFNHASKILFSHVLATNKEVEESLIKEAKNRGLKNIHIVWANDKIQLWVEIFKDKKHTNLPICVEIFNNGKWTEIVEEKKEDPYGKSGTWTYDKSKLTVTRFVENKIDVIDYFDEKLKEKKRPTEIFRMRLRPSDITRWGITDVYESPFRKDIDNRIRKLSEKTKHTYSELKSVHQKVKSIERLEKAIESSCEYGLDICDVLDLWDGFEEYINKTK